MSKTKLTPLQVVERHHERYLEYEKAFSDNPFSHDQLRQELAKIIELGLDMDSDEFVEKMVDIVVEKPERNLDVEKAARKFIHFADFYTLTQEEELPESILKDYENIPIRNSMKPFFSINAGKFVRNEDNEVTPEMRQYFKNVIKQVGTL